MLHDAFRIFILENWFFKLTGGSIAIGNVARGSGRAGGGGQED